jgi:hypothetical protein
MAMAVLALVADLSPVAVERLPQGLRSSDSRQRLALSPNPQHERASEGDVTLFLVARLSRTFSGGAAHD